MSVGLRGDTTHAIVDENTKGNSGKTSVRKKCGEQEKIPGDGR